MSKARLVARSVRAEWDPGRAAFRITVDATDRRTLLPVRVEGYTDPIYDQDLGPSEIADHILAAVKDLFVDLGPLVSLAWDDQTAYIHP